MPASVAPRIRSSWKFPRRDHVSCDSFISDQTPETWVPPLGDSKSGFPYLSGRGRLVIKDAIMLGAGLVTMADSARCYLQRKKESSLH